MSFPDRLWESTGTLLITCRLPAASDTMFEEPKEFKFPAHELARIFAKPVLKYLNEHNPELGVYATGRMEGRIESTERFRDPFSNPYLCARIEVFQVPNSRLRHLWHPRIATIRMGYGRNDPYVYGCAYKKILPQQKLDDLLKDYARNTFSMGNKLLPFMHYDKGDDLSALRMQLLKAFSELAPQQKVLLVR
jgi:hypothetical protein